MQRTFQVANLPTTPSTLLAEMVIRLPSEPAAASTMAEDIFQSPNWRLSWWRRTTPHHSIGLQPWPETHPGKENSARVVTVRTLKGTFKRPITKFTSFCVWTENNRSLSPGGSMHTHGINFVAGYIHFFYFIAFVLFANAQLCLACWFNVAT
jgi:hypothetical protein